MIVKLYEWSALKAQCSGGNAPGTGVGWLLGPCSAAWAQCMQWPLLCHLLNGGSTKRKASVDQVPAVVVTLPSR